MAGTHWIAIYVDSRGRGEYFDPYGLAPAPAFRDDMNRHCSSWTYNHVKLQSVLSRFCDHYSCFSMSRIVSVFANDTTFNDVLVHSFVCR